ncbi:MAG: hypothetical protein JO056_09720 [Alphaproteobacteria bacterium]|nr:hypothetical protein [Alphaproteobacteria bacterium]
MLNRLTRATTIALAVGGFLCAGAPCALAAGKVSKAVGTQLAAAATAFQNGNWQEALNQARAAQAVPDRTPFDDVEINVIMGQAAINLKDMATATAALEAAADSPANTELDPPQRVSIYYNALQLANNAQHWQKVVTYAQVLEPAGKMDDIAYANTAVAYYMLKDESHATQYAQKSIDTAKAAGKQPQENVLKLVMNSQMKSDPAAAERAFEALVMRTNAPADWGQLIGHAWGTKGMNDVLAMDLYRLMFITKSLGANEAGLAGKLANQLRYYGDAVAILEGAGIKGADLNTARSNAAKEQGSISAEISAASKSSGQVALGIAEALYGYGRFADAEQLARGAAAKGKLKTPGEAELLVGMSQVRQGKNAEAVQTFSSVPGNAAVQKVAHLWSMYAQIKQGGASPAAAPAH